MSSSTNASERRVSQRILRCGPHAAGVRACVSYPGSRRFSFVFVFFPPRNHVCKQVPEKKKKKKSHTSGAGVALLVHVAEAALLLLLQLEQQLTLRVQAGQGLEGRRGGGYGVRQPVR